MAREGTKGRYDWDNVLAYYLHAEVSQADVVKRFGMSKSTLERRIERYKWAELKKKAIKNAARNAAKLYSKREGKKLSKLMRASDMLDTAIKLLLTEGAEGKKNAKEIRSLAGALKDAVGIKRDLWQIPALPAADKTEAVTVTISGDAEDYAG